MSDHPPPLYSQGDDTATQLLLVPPANSVNFQTGYLGAGGERAAIEGELQIKDIEPGRWSKVTVSLRSCESAYLREIELAFSQVVLFDSRSNPAFLPSSLPFAVPLTPDTPQSIETHHSSLSHILTATLHPSDETRSPFSKSIIVHTRRYSSHTHSLFPSPETFVLDSPARVEVQVPRTTFKVGEPIPIYITVPPPRREVVLDKGLRLRNVRTELVRVIKVTRDDSDYQELELDEDSLPLTTDVSTDTPIGPSSTSTSALTTSKGPPSPLFLGSSYRTVIAQSGGTCRFHISRDIKLRQVLHQPRPLTHSSRFQPDPPSVDYGTLESDAEGASITQVTLLHSVTFKINVHIAFVDLKNHTEKVSHISIPITMLPPPAPLPEVASSLDEAYQKKHDRPPARTVRHEDDTDVPHYSESTAGPSFTGAPPPFEERDAPPPFSSEAEASTSTRLPTFLESETEIIIPDTDHSDLYQSIPHSPIIMGEGLEFGFVAADQFDGHTDDVPHSNPLQTVQIPTHDADFTVLTDVHTTDALGLVMDNGQEVAIAEDPPPPPPAIDDPSDPPPSIDSEYHSPGQLGHSPPPHSSPLLSDSYSIEPPPPPHTPSNDIQPSHGHAPPPYLNTDHHESEHVTRPPPYVD